MRKFLALPIEEKATHAARALAKLKNEESKVIALLTENRFSEFQENNRGRLKLKQLEKLIERDNQKFEEFLRENERKSVEARALWVFEREEKSKQEKNAVIKKLTAEMRTIQSELEKYEDALTDYLKYKDFLFRLSPPEWQDEKKSKDSKAKTEKTCSPDSDSLEVSFPSPERLTFGDKPELYFTDPQQLLDLMSELTEQNLSLIQNSARVGEGLEKLRQTVDTTRRKISQDQDEMLDALDEKVTEVYSACVENRITDLSTLQKVAKIESRVFSLLQSLEGMPVERLAVVKKVKDSEKRSRMREEKLMEQREKQKERMKRYLERSLADSKKIVRLIPLISQSITAATSKSF
uniref:Cilia and flagella associated protein 100 n=1 Tax=Poecilia latipinna TaxID=48699 RepID=A0A3B3V864_9TELE